MTDWTVERLDELPEETVVAWDGESYSWALKECPGSCCCWISDCGDRWSSEEVFRDARPGSIRVVSVPIDALLSDETVDVAQREAWVSDSEGWSVRHGILAAIAHVTGCKAAAL